MRRVAVTGLGAISALGIGVDALWSGLVAGRSGVRRITLFDPAILTAPIAAEVPDYSPEGRFPDAKLDLLDRFTQFALIAAAEAKGDAGLELADAEADRAGVAVGTGLGAATSEDETFLRFYRLGIVRAHPFRFPG